MPIGSYIVDIFSFVYDTTGEMSRAEDESDSTVQNNTFLSINPYTPETDMLQQVNAIRSDTVGYTVKFKATVLIIVLVVGFGMFESITSIINFDSLRNSTKLLRDN